VSEQGPELVAGSQVAGYRLEERIGDGGMAVVFRAYDYRLDRQVALKILSPALASDEAFRRRFIRESRSAAAVDHPHIIPVFEAGEAGGVLFIAMRLVRGGDVGSLVRRIGPLPAGRAAEIISQTASALDAAHARGLVHRDVKPGNMLLDRSQEVDRPDHVYLSDFGLSKASLAGSGLTAAGQFLGTLDYVAPEQIEGAPVDGRTDQYALACSAFELFTGEPPFRREDGVAVMYAHLHEPTPRLHLRRPEMPDEVDEIVATALAKTPADRYGSCSEFAGALRRSLGLTSAPDSGSRRAHPATEIAMPAVGPDRRPAGADDGGSAGTDQAGPGQPAAPAPAGLGHTAYLPTGPQAGRPAGPGLPQSADAGGAGGLTHDDGPAQLGAVTAGGPTESHLASAAPDGRRARRPLFAVLIAAVVLAAAGGGFALASHGHRAAAITLPGCTNATAKAATLTSVASETVGTGGSPYGAAESREEEFTFVTVGNAVDVFRNGGTLAPTLVRTIAVNGAGRGIVATHNGRFLVAAAGSGAVVISVAAAEQGAPDPVVGSLASPNGTGAVEVSLSPGDNFAFVTLQSSAEMAVFRLQAALASGFSASDFVGYVPLGPQPAGIAAGGGFLYVTSIGGKLSVVSMPEAESHPRSAVMWTVSAGCGPSRALLSPNGRVLWVTARGSDALLAFSTPLLRTDPRRALIANVMVGEKPMGEELVDGGRLIVVADSNLYGQKSASANLAVVQTADAPAGQQALLGYVPTGLLPRQFVLGPGGTLFVTDQRSHQLQALRTADLP
jgi:DNA-binding beta-propeller fold protein YncE